MPRDPQYASWPFDFVWVFFKHTPQGEGAGPGRIRLFHVENMQSYWDVHIVSMDAMARQHMQDRDTKPGQPINMGPMGAEVVPYRDLDDEADRLMQRGMQPSPDRSAVTVRFQSGQQMPNTPREWWESLSAGHIQRRKQEPPVVITVSGTQLTLPYECFDALCKDFMRRRGDFVSAGWWPELVDPYRDLGQHKEGPRPVQGFADALGHGNQVMQGQNQAPGAQPATVHPGVENQDLV